ncbi:MAG: serine/threonine-protein kinase [Gammaproteobacteria bacterium]|nr:serine/threonine-protein kinase [Gammaproteobacteria bacterium]
MLERRQRRRSLSSTGKIGKFSLENVIRTQPTRALYRSYDPFLNRKVAIKIIQLFDPKGEQDQVANESFYAEAQAIGRLQHQNIVSVYDAGVGDYEGYIVMEYVLGESLLDILKAEKSLPLDNALKIAAQICHALDYAHARNIIHRDIKPSNIMITPEGNVKVVDFGISILNTDDAKDSGLMGTPSYMAPELIDGAAANQSSDMFSVAVLLYEMIVGKLPFAGDDAHAVLYKIINSEPDPIGDEVPEVVKLLLNKALSKNVANRFKSAVEFEGEILLVKDQITANDNGYHDLDTSQLKQLEIFEDCTLEVLHDLSNCLEISTVNAGELIFSDRLLDEYLCLVEGKALLISENMHINLDEKQWLSESILSREFVSCSCKALSKAQVLRVSKSNLLESSSTTQAYFYRFVLDHILMH